MTLTAAEIERVSSLIQGLIDADVSALSRDALLDQLQAVGRLEKVAGALGSKYAGEVARRSDPAERGGGFARREGHGNAGGMVSHFTGGSPGRSKRSIEAGEAFRLVPVSQAADAPGQVGGGSGGGEVAVGAGDLGGVAPQVRPRFPLVAAGQTAGDLSVEMAAVIVQGLKLLEGRVDDDYLARVEATFVA
ncbi:MAG: hypothetical protein ACK5IM_06360 [Demequina sp.]|uniref:hypothetical protein n=1 Tax=Demequina sp. TaxID=2050685 RepID=UPI003A8738F3